MTAFVLTDNDGQIRDRDMLDLYDGYLALGVHSKFVTQSEIYVDNPIGKNDIFCGHVNICRHLMKLHKVEEPEIPYYPKVLKPYFGRSIREMELYQFYNLLEDNENYGKTYFVKPKTNKLFTGLCVVTRQDFDRKVPELSINTKLFVSSEVTFGAEFRAYVYKNKVQNCFRYYGDDWKANTPGKDIEDMVGVLTNMPIFYSLDVGTVDGKTLLIEINDGYALGNYGLAPVDYASFSLDRWREIMSK